MRLQLGLFLLVASAACLLYPRNQTAGVLEASATKNVSGDEFPVDRRSIFDPNSSLVGGHWEYAKDIPPPYTFSPQVCEASCLDKGDCKKTKTCATSLMNWVYIGNNNKPYPRFDIDGFRRKMRNSRIVFIGPSIVRQQVQALVWTLGLENITWASKQGMDNCTASRECTSEVKSNITICYQFLGSMAAKVYHDGNYTLDHSLRGHGDSSCLLRDKMIAELNEFDLAFVQTVAWWTRLPRILDAPTSPSKWVSKMLPTVYYDAVTTLLSKLSRQTKTVFVLGQIGTKCVNKTTPVPFSVDEIPTKYSWNLAPRLWNTSLSLIQKEGLDVRIVDARDPLMQSVHAHPSSAVTPSPATWDCLHFCMNSAAINFYLDMFWNKVFSRYMQDE